MEFKMEQQIARAAETSARLFPAISADLYYASPESGNLAPDQKAARHILSLSARKLTLGQRFWGWKLDAGGRLGRLLFFHRAAVEAEMAARVGHADFFWAKAHAELQRLWEQSEIWEEGARQVAAVPGARVLSDPLRLRDTLVKEVFVDTHCAFYNGHLEGADELSVVSRALAHFGFIKELLGYTGMTAGEVAPLLCPPLWVQMELYVEAGKPAEALRLCETGLQRFPESEALQNRLFSLYMGESLGKLASKSSNPQHNIDALAGRIREAETSLFKRFPRNLTLFDLLGSLYYAYAVQLSNAEKFSEALAAAHRSLVYNPALKQADELLAELIGIMEKLREQVAILAQFRRANPGARLTPRQEALEYEATRGFALLNKFVESKARESIAQARHLAQAHTLWRRVGLPKPSEREDESALLLLSAFATVLDAGPRDEDETAFFWEQVVIQRGELGELNRDRVLQYINYYLFEGSEPPLTFDEAVDFAAPAAPPVLRPRPGNLRGRREPFTYWLLSGRDLRVKAQGLVAAVLLLTTGVLVASELWAGRTRDGAYQRVVEAAGRREHRGVIDNAETYLASPPRFQSDKRRKQVVRLYESALLRWTLEQEGELNPEATALIERYRRLMADARE
jgi:hypothetical protein